MKNYKRKIGLIVLVLIITLSFVSCDQKVTIGPEEAKVIAKEAYIYGFPMVMNCKTVYDYVCIQCDHYKKLKKEISILNSKGERRLK